MKKYLLVLIVSLISAPTFAKDGSSGCGPGWYLFKENSLVSSSLRATTNGFLFPTVTIGMTVGTSNCTQHKIVLKEKESLHFVNENFYELIAEASQGGGEYSMALAKTIGCDGASLQLFGQELQKQFPTLIKHNHNQSEDVLVIIYKMILEDSRLLHACSLS